MNWNGCLIEEDGAVRANLVSATWQRRVGLWLAVMAVVLAAAGCGQSAAGDWYIVERVVDGDTFVLTNGERVRMIGVDTPETVKPGTEPEMYGQEASEYTKKMLEGKRVRLEWDVAERDRYGRLLAYVYLEDGTFFNEHLLLEGYARVMTVPPNVKYAERFLAAERSAREAGRGLWGLDPDAAASTADDVPATEETNEDQSQADDQTNAQRGLIKGNINSKGEKIYHVPGGRYYDVTVPEVWFETEEEAQAAGFRRSQY
nr:nuclease [Bacillota bacterium]